jgi:hypothetical protein
MEGLNEMEDKGVALEELLKDYPRLVKYQRANVGAEEVESLNGWIEDFKVVMVGKGGRDRECSLDDSYSE